MKQAHFVIGEVFNVLNVFIYAISGCTLTVLLFPMPQLSLGVLSLDWLKTFWQKNYLSTRPARLHSERCAINPLWALANRLKVILHPKSFQYLQIEIGGEKLLMTMNSYGEQFSQQKINKSDTHRDSCSLIQVSAVHLYTWCIPKNPHFINILLNITSEWVLELRGGWWCHSETQ